MRDGAERSTLSERKYIMRMRKNLLTSINGKVVRCPIKSRGGWGGVRGYFVHISDLPWKFMHQIYVSNRNCLFQQRVTLAMPLTLKVPVFLGSFFRKFCLALSLFRCLGLSSDLCTWQVRQDKSKQIFKRRRNLYFYGSHLGLAL